MQTADPTSFPPPGWVTNHEAARMLGVGLNTLTCSAWKWRPLLRGSGKRVRHPNRRLCNIYPLAQIERIRQEQAAAAEPQIPPGSLTVTAHAGCSV